MDEVVAANYPADGEENKDWQHWPFIILFVGLLFYLGLNYQASSAQTMPTTRTVYDDYPNLYGIDLWFAAYIVEVSYRWRVATWLYSRINFDPCQRNQLPLRITLSPRMGNLIIFLIWSCLAAVYNFNFKPFEYAVILTGLFHASRTRPDEIGVRVFITLCFVLLGLDGPALNMHGPDFWHEHGFDLPVERWTGFPVFMQKIWIAIKLNPLTEFGIGLMGVWYMQAAVRGWPPPPPGLGVTWWRRVWNLVKIGLRYLGL